MNCISKIAECLGRQHTNNFSTLTLREDNLEKLEQLTEKLAGAPQLDVFVHNYEGHRAIFSEGECWCDRVYYRSGVMAIMECTMKKGWEIPEHMHDQIEIGVVLKGKGKFNYGGRDRVVTKDDVVVFNPNEPHSYESLEDTIMLFTSIPPAKGYPK